VQSVLKLSLLILALNLLGYGLIEAKSPTQLPARPPAMDPKSPLDQVSVQRLYGDGDFDPAIQLLEDFQKSHPNFSREESLMVYKYLGVMYTADQSTREKGKTYFYKLLKIDPEAKILDLYVSIVVQEIFKGTLDELMGQKSAASPTGKTQTGNIHASQSHATVWWIGGSLGLTASIIGGYYLYTQSSHAAKDEFIQVPD
jgi:hypothetical protein